VLKAHLFGHLRLLGLLLRLLTLLLLLLGSRSRCRSRLLHA
jgi:hypothetical protein